MLLGSSPPPAVFITLTSKKPPSLLTAKIDQSGSGLSQTGSATATILTATKSTCGSTVTMSFPTSVGGSAAQNPPSPLHYRRTINRFNEGSLSGLISDVKKISLGDLEQISLEDLKVGMTTAASVFPMQTSPMSSAGSSAQSSPELMSMDYCTNNNNGNGVNGRTGNLHKKSSCPTSMKRAATKRVAFADDRGFQLVTIRLMTEPSDVPPVLKINNSAERVTFFAGSGSSNEGSQNAISDQEDPPNFQWSLTFKQPASDYLAFRQKIDIQNVALENVIVKNDERRCVSGTIKVKNLAFEKRVFARVTFDQWATHNDFQAKYKPMPKKLAAVISTSGNRSPELFDTFEFLIELPKFQFDQDDTKNNGPPQNLPGPMQFCVCYRTPSGEFWDNNGGSNFTLICQRYPERKTAATISPTIDSKENSTNQNSSSAIASSAASNRNSSSSQDQQPIKSRPSSFPTFRSGRCGSSGPDAFTMNMTNWTQFSSWNHLSTDGPYW